MIKIYLFGSIFALIIEIMTAIRIKQFTKYEIGFICFAMLSSWIWVGLFFCWVYSAMGWNYEDMKGNNPNPYIPIAWRVKRDGK